MKYVRITSLTGLTPCRTAASFAFMGALGLWEPPCEKARPERLTSSHACLDVFKLRALGLMVEGASGSVQTGYGGGRLSVPRPGILEIDGAPVRFAAHRCIPAEVFLCPECGKDCYRLYDVKGWRCRKCARLKYPSQCRNRGVPGWARLLWLRRRLHASEVAFSALPQVFPWQRRRWRLVTEVRKIEAGLIGHAGRISATIEKRYGRAGRRRDA